MIGTNQSEYNRLYLLKENKNELFLNNCHLIKQHQIDGLRFLFKQFKKKKPVAVVNFPAECGKSVTVALFLSAISSWLKKPVLIICSNESEIDCWKEIILKWSEYNIDDIAIEPNNVYIKKKILLKTAADLVSYQRPNWSIVITKEVTKSMLKLTFNADLKIWITSTDVKKDVATLACVYNWCLPMSKTKPTMNPNDFISSGNKMKDKIEKAILLDAYIEDFVIQETRIEPFTKKRKSNTLIANTSGGKEKTPQKSRKNKDATGTKIKRTRKILADDDIVIESKENVSISNDESQNILLNFDTELLHNDEKSHEKRDLDDNDLATSKMELKSIKTNEGLENDKESSDINSKCDINIHNSEMVYEDIGSQSICLEYNILENNLEVYENPIRSVNVSEENVKDGVKNQSHEKIDTKDNIAETHSDKEKMIDNVSTDNIEKEVLKQTDYKEMETDNIKESPKDLDISEWEAKALKKFKGSLLDSIF